MSDGSLTIVCLLWVLPLVWAILVAHRRQAADCGDIVATAVCTAVLSFGLGCFFCLAVNDSQWMDTDAGAFAGILALLAYGCSWIAVLWAHLGASIKIPSPHRGFPIEPARLPKTPDA